MYIHIIICMEDLNGLFVRQYFPHPSLLESIMKEFSGYLHNALTQFEGKGIIQEVSK